MSVLRERARDSIQQFRDMGRPFETHNSLIRSWSVLRFPISPVVWFQYYRELEAFVRTTEGDSTLYLHGTVFMPFGTIFSEHIRLTVYKMFYFNTPYFLWRFLRRIRFRLLFVGSTAYEDRITIERLSYSIRPSNTLYYNGMYCES